MRPYQALTDKDTVLGQERPAASSLHTPQAGACARGQLNLHRRLVSMLHLSSHGNGEGIVAAPSRRYKSRSRSGSVGCLGLLVGPQRKVRKWMARSVHLPFTWTSAGNGG